MIRAGLDHIIGVKYELVQQLSCSARRYARCGLDGEIAPLYRDARLGIATRFMIGLLLPKHIFGPPDEGACERRVSLA
jgi:transposase, IS5 family